MKNKETLEEAAQKLFPVFNRSTPFGDKYPWIPKKERAAFIKGAQWQQERMYSEEDMKKAIRFGFDKGFCSNSSNKVKNTLLSEKDGCDFRDHPNK